MAFHIQAPVETVNAAARRTICWLSTVAYHDVILFFLFPLSVGVDVSGDELPHSRLQGSFMHYISLLLQEQAALNQGRSAL